MTPEIRAGRVFTMAELSINGQTVTMVIDHETVARLKDLMGRSTAGPWVAAAGNEIGTPYEIMTQKGVAWHHQLLVDATPVLPDLQAEAERTAREVVEAERNKAQEVLLRWVRYGCPDCYGDCASAQPPVAACIMRETFEALQ